MASTLRERRKRARLTERKLVDLAGCSRSMVKFLEGGYTPPRRSAVRERLERALAEVEERTA